MKIQIPLKSVKTVKFFPSIEEVDSDEWNEDEEEFDEEDVISNNDCLFCLNHSNSMEKNLLHMSEKHSFFVPDMEFITDLEGMMCYLGAKVSLSLVTLSNFLEKRAR